MSSSLLAFNFTEVVFGMGQTSPFRELSKASEVLGTGPTVAV